MHVCSCHDNSCKLFRHTQIDDMQEPKGLVSCERLECLYIVIYYELEGVHKIKTVNDSYSIQCNDQ